MTGQQRRMTYLVVLAILCAALVTGIAFALAHGMYVLAAGLVMIIIVLAVEFSCVLREWKRRRPYVLSLREIEAYNQRQRRKA